MKVSNSPNSKSLEQITSEKVDKRPAAKTKAEKSEIAENGSQVSISDQARLMKTATELVHQIPDIRAERVADIKNRILSGTYEVDAAGTAEKLIQEHLLSDFGKNNL